MCVTAAEIEDARQFVRQYRLSRRYAAAHV